MIEFFVGKGGIEPQRKFGDAGFDFFVPENFITVMLEPGKDILINTHIRSKFPENRALIAFNKSGIATRHNLQVGACVVDSSYQGEIHIHVYNWGPNTIPIVPGMKLTQFVPIKIEPKDCMVVHEEHSSVDDFYGKKTERGEGGFGSTGIMNR